MLLQSPRLQNQRPRRMPLKNLAKDTFIYGGGDLAAKLIAFVAYPLIAAAITPREFGTIELVWTSVALLMVFTNCGLNNALSRYYWDEDTKEGERPALVSTGVYIQLFLTLVFAGLVAIAAPFITAQINTHDLPMSHMAILFAVLLLFARQTIKYLQDIMRLHFAPVKFIIFTLLGQVFTIMSAVVAVVFFEGSVDEILMVQALSGLIVIPLGIIFACKDIKLTFSKIWMKRLLEYGYPFIFASLAYWLFSSMDRWMLSFLDSVEEVGIYSVSARFASVVLFVVMAFGQAWSPYAIKIRTDRPNDYKEMYSLIFLVFLLVMLALGGGVAMFSGEILSVIMPPEYMASALPLSILAFGIVVQSTQQITVIGISLSKKTKVLAAMAWVTAFVNFGANMILIPHFGAQGAAWATLLSYAVLTGGYMFFSQRYYPINWHWVRMLVMAVLGLAVLAVAVIYNAQELDWKLAAGKLIFCLICLAGGVMALPLKRIKALME